MPLTPLAPGHRRGSSSVARHFVANASATQLSISDHGSLGTIFRTRCPLDGRLSFAHVNLADLVYCRLVQTTARRWASRARCCLRSVPRGERPAVVEPGEATRIDEVVLVVQPHSEADLRYNPVFLEVRVLRVSFTVQKGRLRRPIQQ